jgi:hypothetical protein
VQVQEGQGWRLAVDPSRRRFPVLIGGSGWGAELTASEAWALRLGVGRLVREHRGLVATLREEEAIELDLEVALGPGSLWLALEGDRGGWSLRIVLTPAGDQRGLEGSWLPGASEAFAAALELASPFPDRPLSLLRPAGTGAGDQQC